MWTCLAGRVVLTRCAASTPARDPPSTSTSTPQTRPASQGRGGAAGPGIRAGRGGGPPPRSPVSATYLGRQVPLRVSAASAPPPRAARRLRAHARRGARAGRQPGAPRPTPPPAPHSRPFSLGPSAPRRGCGGGVGGASRGRWEPIRERGAPPRPRPRGQPPPPGGATRSWAPGSGTRTRTRVSRVRGSLQACACLQGGRSSREP